MNGESETSGFPMRPPHEAEGQGPGLPGCGYGLGLGRTRNWGPARRTPIFRVPNKVAARQCHPAPVGACIKDKAAKS
jgi:hypothetical protein